MMKLLATNAWRGALGELLPRFARASGYAVEPSYDPAKVVLRRVAAGERADAALLGCEALDELARAGKIAPGSRPLARCGVGVAVRAGAPKPDLSSVESFRQALLAARSIAYTRDGASGLHFARVIEGLGIAAEVQAKAVTRSGGLIGELLVTGETELAVQQIPELLAVPGIQFAGPLPAALQLATVTCAGVFAGAQHAAAARALIEFLACAEAAAVLVAKGLEPVRHP
jgi:molybdate transport system substrate-binding protein